ncbi:S-adenosylmethionine mitochondrial carrier protein [Hondaea fermentalgiana]|uniref:S-adenosylmethionine mitochondrial carrier protein n=1 Tax=Hondaea fermentalgiana TaxID=2315210 RepID=A0A2R5GCI5_9STRA|nr:S-adenosylmethionine mitochondrial carrier protein [Hondaea fermentalgiana]|eukprot:GBG26313.1 S-adenosylmethionine mitochondrial carrier protein [Hondaea fermentalgiana]
MGVDVTALVAGGVAGFSVDTSLMPLDAIKTRLQSPMGFRAAGGFSNLFAGVGVAALGSVPGASLFFFTYETTKANLAGGPLSDYQTQMAAASLGEIAACLIRVPVENVKQKRQAGLFKDNSSALRGIMARQGYSGFYTGYWTTVLREIPFSMIQFPLWEALKVEIGRRRGDGTVHSWESAAAGSASGALAAAVTTPLDVVKTRLMLGSDPKGVPYDGALSTLQRVVRDEGAGKLMAGVGPRVFWIGIGGFVYFFAYQKTRYLLEEST